MMPGSNGRVERAMLRICLAVLTGMLTLLIGGAAFAMDAILDSALDQGGAVVHAVKPGDAFDIVGNCLDMARSSHDVRVVLQLAGKPDKASMGYREVLATEQHLGKTALQVRVPEMPEMANHTFRVKVFVLDSATPGTCEAGQIRVG